MPVTISGNGTFTGTSFTANNIAANTITSNNIATNTITSNNISSTSRLASGNMVAGSIIQVLQGWKSDTFSTTSTSLQDVAGLSVTITPTSSASKFLIMVNLTYLNTFYTGHVALIRNGTEIAMADAASNRPRNFLFYSNSTNGGADGQWVRESMDYLDSPATASAITYKLQASARRDGQGGTMYINRSNPDRDTTGYDGRGVSSIIVMEVAQ